MRRTKYIFFFDFLAVIAWLAWTPDAFAMGMNMGDNDQNSHQMMKEHTVALKKAPGSPNKLNLPPILKPDKTSDKNVYYTVRAQQGQMNFKDGKATQTLGYNGNYLGPVIELTKGQTVHIKEINDLKENTTFHWHGAIISGKADGGPHDPLKPGQTRNIKFKVDQPAATLWFHPHPSGLTGKQVYQGLSGLIYINDVQSKKLNLPKNYGVDDFPLVVQDRSFTKNNQLDYQKDYNADGTLGKNLLVNGTLNPYINVTTRFVRLRLLNGSNARNYDFSLDHHQSMYQIAGDGSFLVKPVKLKKLQLAPAERAEILIDTKKLKDETSLKLKTDGKTIVTLNMMQRSDNLKKMPKVLKKMKTVKRPTKNVAKQKLVLSGMSQMVRINGKKFDPDRIDIHAKRGQNQIWTVENKKEMMMNMIHPFHLHGVQFRILSINGKKPPLTKRGYLDTITLKPGDKYKITFKFEKKGLYMYHCHILEHEENGMMGQVLVK